VLLLDEPFSGLDAPARDWLAAGMRERLVRGGAVLLTDHDGAMDGRLPAAAVLRLGDGTAHRDAPAPDPRATALASVAVLATHPDGRRIEERLAPDAVDARLLTLLREGWHIERVAP
jgi:ABC-type sulfate/molybdate transport systems ATPase subunit